MNAIVDQPAQYPINSSNASTMAKLRWSKWRAEKDNAEIQRLSSQVPPVPAKQSEIHATIMQQIESLDEAMSYLRGKAIARDMPRLAQAKATLYALLFPKPRAGRSNRQPPPQVEPQTPQG